MTGSQPRYVIISPVKDEERYVELTLRSVTGQTLLPALWLIVDDGSTDGTLEIVSEYASRYPFIKVLRHRKGGARRPGSPVIHAFNHGYAALAGETFDYVVKLDCDLSFGEDYFERLLGRFERDPRLGIASGVYLETDAVGAWIPVKMPPYHAFGASKVLRAACFEEIGGFPAAAGWDTVDEIRAMSRQWRTGHFEDLQVKHHKREGSGIGQVRTNRMHGEIFYVTGGDPLFLLFKVLHRISVPPVGISGLALAAGYVAAVLKRKPRLVTADEARYYRRLLRRRLLWRSEPPQLASLPSGH